MKVFAVDEGMSRIKVVASLQPWRCLVAIRKKAWRIDCMEAIEMSVGQKISEQVNKRLIAYLIMKAWRQLKIVEQKKKIDEENYESNIYRDQI